MTSKDKGPQGICADVSTPQTNEAIEESPAPSFPFEPILLDDSKADGLYWGTNTVVDSVITIKIHSA